MKQITPISMNVLLDENVTESAIKYLENYGHNVQSIKSLGLSGKGFTDEGVLNKAIEFESVLITHNGKDFIDSIPPRKDIMHFGLLWLRTNMNYRNSKGYCECLQEILIHPNLKNTIWKVMFGKGVQKNVCNYDRRHP